MSSPKKPVSLLGRLAVQLKMISMDQLNAATREQGNHPDKRLGEIFVEQGLLSVEQLAKLEKLQRDVVAKHRAKKADSARAATGRGLPPTRSAPIVEGERAPRPAAAAQAAGTQPSPPAAPAAAPEAPATPAAPVAKVAEPAPAPDPPAAAPPPTPRAQAPVEAGDPGEPGDSLGLSLGRGEGARDELHQILGDAVAAGASDIHIHAGASLRLRVNGRMMDAGSEIFAPEKSEALALAALTPDTQEELAHTGEIDCCVAVDGIGRFRTNAYRQQRGFDVVFRSIPPKPPTLDELGLPNSLAKFTNYHQGMVLLTGPAGCGKSATMAALVNLINEERDEHILTIEDPIEYVHEPKRCLVNQRHAGRHTGSFARALRAALREDPDVIVIGELRDLETISLAMTAAETGHFVLATLHTSNAVRTINRMIGAFPSNRQDQVRTMLSESLRAVISQRLVPTADESGRVPALEVLVINKAIGNLIRDEKTVQIRSSIQTGASHGMTLLEQSLNQLVKAGTIDVDEALRLAEDKKLIQT